MPVNCSVDAAPTALEEASVGRLLQAFAVDEAAHLLPATLGVGHLVQAVQYQKAALLAEHYRGRPVITSGRSTCYRYWGQGQWTEYGREICRRAGDILNYHFA